MRALMAVGCGLDIGATHSVVVHGLPFHGPGFIGLRRNPSARIDVALLHSPDLLSPVRLATSLVDELEFQTLTKSSFFKVPRFSPPLPARAMCFRASLAVFLFWLGCQRIQLRLDDRELRPSAYPALVVGTDLGVALANKRIDNALHSLNLDQRMRIVAPPARSIRLMPA